MGPTRSGYIPKVDWYASPFTLIYNYILCNKKDSCRLQLPFSQSTEVTITSLLLTPPTTLTSAKSYLPDNLPDKASPGETGSASRVTQTEIVYKVTHLYNVFPIAA